MEAGQQEQAYSPVHLISHKNIPANLADGFDRLYVHDESITSANWTAKVMPYASVILMKPGAKADVIVKGDPTDSKKSYFSESGPDFAKITKDYNAVVIVAGTYTTENGELDGGFILNGNVVKLDKVVKDSKGNVVKDSDGNVVTEKVPAEPTEAFESGSPSKGLLVIDKKGGIQIKYLSEFSGLDDLKSQANDNDWTVIQCTSIIRPNAGQFKSSSTRKFNYRFFVEGEGTFSGAFKGVVNFTTPMLYADAIKMLQDIGVKKAVQLDTGDCGTGKLIDADRTMINFGDGGNMPRTNVLVLHP